MLESLFTIEALISLATLTPLEIFLGMDIIIFIAILGGVCQIIKEIEHVFLGLHWRWEHVFYCYFLSFGL